MSSHRETELTARITPARDIAVMRDLLVSVRTPAGTAASPDILDGWCKPAGPSGFRYDYDINIARGGWEYHEVGNGLTVVLTDMVAVLPTPRLHHVPDHLMMSIIIDGVIPLDDPRRDRAIDAMSRGFCTLYGRREGEPIGTVYQAGQHLRWLTLMIDCRRFGEATGIDVAELPADVRDFIAGTGDLPPRNIATVHQTLLTASQLLECPFDGTMRTTYLRSKALELICHVLTAAAGTMPSREDERLSKGDIAKLEAAMQIVRSSLQQPRSVDDIARRVGLSRRRLQAGFRQLYGNTVCNARDRLRMELAHELVTDSAMPMIEIAMETGYEHPASFTRAFKSAFGTSPMAIRNAVRANRVARRRRERAAPRAASID
jgi:AraC-like DNA-binding protein